jgi:hypothetical protein
VLTVLYLRHLERRVWSVLADSALRALRMLDVAPAAMPAAPIAPLDAPAALHGIRLRHAISRRGPPQLAGA